MRPRRQCVRDPLKARLRNLLFEVLGIKFQFQAPNSVFHIVYKELDGDHRNCCRYDNNAKQCGGQAAGQ